MIDTHGIEWLPVTEAAQRLDVKPSTVYAWLSRGKVRSHRIGGRAWVRVADLADAEHKTRGAFARQRRARV